ncbi:MAG: hypothetical protein WCL51_09990 [Bacteroidota bacterium]
MALPDERLEIGTRYTIEEIESLGFVIKKQAHVGLICRKDDYIYIFDPVKPTEGKGYTFKTFVKD